MSQSPESWGAKARILGLGHIGLKISRNSFQHSGKVLHQGWRGSLFYHGPDDLHLVFGPLVVPFGKAHPLPGKGQCLNAGELVVPLPVGADILHRELPVRVDADAPQGVDDLPQSR